MATSSKARARPIPRIDESDSESSRELADDSGDRLYSLLSPRRPKLHSIKGPFSLILGGFLQDPPEVVREEQPSNSSSDFPMFYLDNSDLFVQRALSIVI